MWCSVTIAAFAGFAVASIASSEAGAQAVVKIGAVQSMTGAFSNTGRETIDGARLYLRQHGDLVAGKNVELVAKDDTGLPDVGKRLAQELIVNDKVAVLLGGITPSALSIVPLTTEAKNSHDCLGFGIVDHRRALSLRGANELHPRAIGRNHRRMGDQERCETDRHPGE